MRRYCCYFVPLICLLAFMLLLYLFNVHHVFSLETLKQKHSWILQFSHEHPLLFPLFYFFTYVLSVLLVVPDSTFLSLIGGLIFPIPIAVLLIATAEACGSLLFFLILQWTFKGIAQKHVSFVPIKIQNQFRAHAASFLLFLRISHIIPFWLLNTCAAYFFTPIRTFIWTTWVGLLPLSYLLADIGHNLSKALQNSSGHITLSDLFTPSMKLALLGLGFLSLIPLLFQLWIDKKK